MHRRIALGVPGLALASGVGLWTQVRRVTDAPLPDHPDGDPSGRYGDPAGAPVRITALGDSTLTGPGLGDGSQVWIARLADRLPFDVHLTSHAVGGSRVGDVLARQVPAALVDPPDLFVVAVGVNDVMHATPGWRFRRDLERLLDVLRGAAPVVSVGIGDLSVIPRLPPALRPLVRVRCRSLDRLHARASAGRGGVTRVSVAERSDPHFARHRGHIFGDDLFHPNHRGHAIWAECFESPVRNAIEACMALDRRVGSVPTPAWIGRAGPASHADLLVGSARLDPAVGESTNQSAFADYG